MKKLITLALIAAFAFSLCGCGVEKLPTYEELKGSVSGDTYENSYLGIKFKLPDGWRFYSDEEIEQATGQTADILNEAGAEVEVGSQYYDMMAIDDNTGNNINCSLQIVGNTGKVDYDEIIDAIVDSVKQYGDSLGFEYSFSDRTEVKFCGMTFHKYLADVSYESIGFKQAGYIVCEKGVVINITVTIMDGSSETDIEAMFE